MTKEIKVTITYKYFLKSTRLNISKSQYIQRRGVLKRGINSSMMFVRAPKHFKRGKQHMFLFNGRFIRVHRLYVTPSSSTLFFSQPSVIFNYFGALREFNFSDTVISRVTVQSIGTLNLIVYGWCSFFSISS
jgi:hypothetical protein